MKNPVAIQSNPQFEDAQQPHHHPSPILEQKVEDNGGLKESDVLLEIDPNVEKSDNVVLRKLLRGPRYFDPADNNWGNCSNCGEAGHVVGNCTAAKRKRPCFVCGSLEHNAKKCRQGKDCYICKKGGHRARNCPEKSIEKLKQAKLCLKCGNSDHEMYTCNTAYSAEDLKEVQCYICKSFGHLCCVDYGEGPTEISCCRCGQLGHNGSECKGTSANVEPTNTASPLPCYKCGGEGHKARKCKTSAKKRKRKTAKGDHLKGYNDHLSVKSAPPEVGESRKKNKRKRRHSPSSQPKRRGGWMNGDPVHYDTGSTQWGPTPPRVYSTSSQPTSNGGPVHYNMATQWGSPTQHGYVTSSQPISRGGWMNEDLGGRYNGAPHWGPPSAPVNYRFDDHYNNTQMGSPSTPASYRSHNSFHESHYGSGYHYEASSSNGYQHRFSASRFGNSGNHGRRDYDWN